MLYLQDKVRGLVQVPVLRGPNGPSFSGSLRGVRTNGTPGDGGAGGHLGGKDQVEQVGECRTLMAKRPGEQMRVSSPEAGSPVS